MFVEECPCEASHQRVEFPTPGRGHCHGCSQVLDGGGAVVVGHGLVHPLEGIVGV